MQITPKSFITQKPATFLFPLEGGARESISSAKESSGEQQGGSTVEGEVQKQREKKRVLEGASLCRVNSGERTNHP